MLLQEMRAGNITALIARSADFYGPHARTSIANILVFDNLAKHARPSWLVNDAVAHSFTFTPDAAHGLALLAANEAAWNRTWHLPTAPSPPTGKQFISIAAHAFGTEPRHRVLSRPMIGLASFVSSDVRETREMLYQYDSEYVFDSTKFCAGFRSPADSIHRRHRAHGTRLRRTRAITSASCPMPHSNNESAPH